MKKMKKKMKKNMSDGKGGGESGCTTTTQINSSLQNVSMCQKGGANPHKYGKVVCQKKRQKMCQKNVS